MAETKGAKSGYTKLGRRTGVGRMIGCMKTVTLEDPDFAGTYTVERRDDGALVLEPVVTDMRQIRDRLGSEPASVEEFEAQYGRLLPPDDEG